MKSILAFWLKVANLSNFLELLKRPNFCGKHPFLFGKHPTVVPTFVSCFSLGFFPQEVDVGTRKVAIPSGCLD